MEGWRGGGGCTSKKMASNRGFNILNFIPTPFKKRRRLRASYADLKGWERGVLHVAPALSRPLYLLSILCKSASRGACAHKIDTFYMYIFMGLSHLREVYNNVGPSGWTKLGHSAVPILSFSGIVKTIFFKSESIIVTDKLCFNIQEDSEKWNFYIRQQWSKEKSH